VGVDFRCFLPPRLAGVLEVAHQFLFLGIRADPRVAGAVELLTLGGNVPELLIPFGVRLARMQHLAMATQTVALLSQQPADGGRAGPAVQRLR
jgi:hypothetical protein